MSDRELRLKIMLDGVDKASAPIDAVRKVSREAAKAFRETRADLGKLNRTAKDVKGYRELKRGLEATGTELDGAKKKVANLANQMKRAEAPAKQLTRDFERAKREAAELGRKFDRQQIELQETRDRMKEAGVHAGRLATDERELARRIKETNHQLTLRKAALADAKASEPRRLQEARLAAKIDGDIESARMRRADRWNDRARYGTGMLGLAVGAAATTTGVDAAIEAATYEKTMTSIGQKADLTRAQAQRLGDTLRTIAPDTGRMPQDMAAGADTLAGIGLLSKYDAIKNPEKRYQAIESASRSIMLASGKAATAYEGEQEDMVAAAAAGVQNLKISADKAQKIFDIMAAGDNAGAFSMKAMARELPSLTGIWGSLGQTGETALGQLVAGLEIAKTNTGDESTAANNLLNLLVKLNSPQLATNFKKFGINLPAELKKGKAEGRDLLEVITELTNRATKGDNDKIGQLFTDQQAQMAVIALNGHLKEYLRLRDQATNSTGLVDKQFSERMKDQAARWDVLKSQWSNFEIEVGKSMKPVTDRLLDGAVGILGRLTANIRSRGLLATAGTLAGPGLVGLIPKEELERAKARHPKQAPPENGWMVKDSARRRAASSAAPPAMPWSLKSPNATARALQDQRRAMAVSLDDTRKFKLQMQKQIGTGADYSAIGSLMMDGLRLGMNARLPGVLASVSSIANRIRSAFRGKMEIHSPSRVFNRYGRFITEGLAQGIDASRSQPVAAMQSLASAMTPRAAPPAAGGAPGAGSSATGGIQIGKIEIHQQPGENADQLVKRVVDEIERRAAAARRGSYRDHG